MKYLSILLVCFSSSAFAQSPVEAVSAKLAQRAKDSLSLSKSKQVELQAINMQLAQKKRVVWQNYNTADSVTFYLQKIENTRDSLYRTVLSEQQFSVYKMKKDAILNHE